MSAVIERQSTGIIVMFSFSTTTRDGEPDLEEMDEIARLIDKVMGSGIPLGIKTEMFERLPDHVLEEDYIRPLKTEVIRQVSEMIDAEGMYCALYVFALFRFDLTVKDLTWLSSRTGMSVADIRSLSNLARRVRRKKDWK